MSQLRRRISAAASCNQSKLLERMSHVGEGAQSAEKRRYWVRVEQEKMEERQAGSVACTIERGGLTGLSAQREILCLIGNLNIDNIYWKFLPCCPQ